MKDMGKEKEGERAEAIFACILTRLSLVWKWMYWDSPQWKVSAIHSHRFTHVMHTLLIRSHTVCIGYSYARVRYAYVTQTLAYVINRLFIRLNTLRIWNDMVKYATLTVVDRSGLNTQYRLIYLILPQLWKYFRILNRDIDLLIVNK